MTKTIPFLAAMLLVLAPLSANAIFGDKPSADERRQELQDARQAALKKLFAEKPAAKAKPAKKPGTSRKDRKTTKSAD